MLLRVPIDGHGDHDRDRACLQVGRRHALRFFTDVFDRRDREVERTEKASSDVEFSLVLVATFVVARTVSQLALI